MLIFQGCPTITLSHQYATKTLKHATVKIELALSNMANSQTAWQTKPFNYYLYLLFGYIYSETPSYSIVYFSIQVFIIEQRVTKWNNDRIILEKVLHYCS